MKYAKTKIFFSLAMLVITAVLLCSTVTLAWYSIAVSKNLDFVVYSDGKIVIKFDSGIVQEPTDGKLIPAKEAPTAIINGEGYDVKTLSSAITSVANTLTYKATIIAYIEEVVTDIGGDKVVSNPRNINYELGATIKTRGGETYELTSDEMRNVFGYTLGKVEVAKPPLSTTDSNYVIDPPPATGYTDLDLSNTYAITENKIIYVQLQVWLNQPEGLLPNELLDSDVTFHLGVRMEEI